MTTPTFEERQGFFPIGTQYHRAPTPRPDEWETDLREIARVGFTHVQLRPQWRWHERVRGAPTWSDLDRLFDLAADNGLRVVLKPMLETAPDWVFGELDGRRIGFHGVPIDPIAHGAYYVGGWWPCFDNPGVADAAAAFVRALVARYREHSALWFYDAWNEPVSRPVGQCQCEHSVRSYRDWLKRRFGSVEALNEQFGKAWTAFDTLLPPQSNADYAEMFLWKQWADVAVAEQVRFAAAAIRAEHPQAFILVHAGGCNVIQDPVWAPTDDLLNATHTDRYGTSFTTELNPVTPTEQAQPDYQSDWLRRVDPSYWCHEFYPNSGNWCRPPEPRTLARQVWMAIAGGAAGLTFWQYRSERVGNETNGFGMREIDGSPTPRSDVIDRIAGVLREHGTRLVGARRPQARVALLYSRASDRIGRLQDFRTGPWDISQEPGNVDYPAKRALHAMHALHTGRGEAVDWVVPGDDLAGVALLHISCAEMIDADTAEWLRDYVEGGGSLVVEFPFACRDDNTWVSVRRPNHGLDELLGCREAERVVIEPDRPQRAEFDDGTSVTAQGWCVRLTAADSAEVIARWADGSTASVVNRCGRGTVVSLGVSLSLSFTDAWTDADVRLAFARVCGLAGCAPRGWPDGVWLRQRTTDDGAVLFVFNVAATSRRVALPAAPRTQWYAEGAALEHAALRLEPGATWVGDLAEPLPC